MDCVLYMVGASRNLCVEFDSGEHGAIQCRDSGHRIKGKGVDGSGQGLANIFATEEPHDFDNLTIHPVIDRMGATDTSPITFADMIDGGMTERVFRYFMKMALQYVVVDQSLFKTKSIRAKS